MTIQASEYESLRQELLDHQKERMPVLNLALTTSAVLFAAGVQFGNFVLPLLALVFLSFAGMYLTRIDYAIQRIASFIRVVIEQQDSSGVSWELGSYWVRSYSTGKRLPTVSEVKHHPPKRVWNVSSLFTFEVVLIFTGLAAVGLAALVPWITPGKDPPKSDGVPSSVYISVGVGVVWLLLWFFYWLTKVRKLNNMSADDSEAKFWRWFKDAMPELRKYEEVPK